MESCAAGCGMIARILYTTAAEWLNGCGAVNMRLRHVTFVGCASVMDGALVG